LLAQEEHESLVLNHLLDRAEPVRTFGMARRGEMFKTSGWVMKSVISALSFGR
jgi:hypothetical protein